MGELNVENRTMFCKDNLEVLEGINSDCIDLIYLDPPFNKHQTFTAPIDSHAEGASFEDIFRKEDVKDEWLKIIKEDCDELHTFLEFVKTIEGSSSYNYCYLAYMAFHLIEMKRVLKDTGSIYLHCDSTMSHYWKLLMDCIFGEKNFRNEIVWWYGGAGTSKRRWGTTHDILLFYVKGQQYVFNADDVREDYKWIKGQKRADGSKRDYKKGKLLDDVFHLNRATPWAKESKGYQTQKPLSLLERIIKASSNKKDVILDPFCGCATTCVAAEKLGRQWIGIDVSIKAYELVKERLEKEVADSEDLFKCSNIINFKPTPPKRTDVSKSCQPKKWVYVISHPNYPGEYKVGVSKDYKSRFRSYQTGDPNRQYKMVFKLKKTNFNETEHYIHNKYSRKHEWVTGNLKDIIRDITNYKGSNMKQVRLDLIKTQMKL